MGGEDERNRVANLRTGAPGPARASLITSSPGGAYGKAYPKLKDLAKVLKTALPDLPDDTKELAKIASIDLEKIERFLRICILLLGKNELLRMPAELKVEVIEGRGPHNPTGTLIWRLLTEISQPVRANRFTPSPA